jgi:ADP-heptose:LPS heptosyltransferase
MENKTILLSRTDSIGDVVLSLPMAGLIKEKYPNSKVLFLGKSYTKDIILCSKYIDKFINWSEIENLSLKQQISMFKQENIDIFIHVFPNKHIAKIAKKSNIKTRIGTSHRPYHYLYCNQLESFSRKKSELHESQLNIKLLSSLEIEFTGNYQALSEYYGFENIAPLEEKWNKLLSKDKRNVILHTKSKGSAREWGLDNFKLLINQLLKNNCRVFLTGTEDEGLLFRNKLVFQHNDLIDLSGKMTLNELVSFISRADSLVAASTGPLHIAAATGIQSIGIFPPIRPMHPGRWSPIGKNVEVFVTDKPHCTDCQNGEACKCMQQISYIDVYNTIIKY